MQDIEFLFYPRSIAIVGASSDPYSRVNQGFLQPLLESGYQGRIYPVNPYQDEIMGLKAYPNVQDIPEPVDYVICSIPAPLTIQLMQDCVAARVKAVALYTAGFSETEEEEGIRLEKELVETARRGGVRILGPNCLGIHSPAVGLSLEADSLKECGHTAFFSQSGGNTRDLLIIAAARGIYFNKVASYGNAADLNESDFLEYFARDADTKIIAAYVEGIKQPQRFLNALREATDAKPVIIHKGGGTEAGTKAVVSHTGALAGSRKTWDALCQQTGVMQVGNLEELADTILAFSYFKPPQGRRIGIIGAGGGISVQAADDCEKAGLTLLPFPQEVRKELSKFAPTVGASLRNPIDSPAEIYWDPSLLSKTIEFVANCGSVDALFVILIARYAIQRRRPKVLYDQIEAITESGKRIDKPLAIILLRTNTIKGEKVNFEAQARCFRAGFAPYPSVDRAAQAMSRFISYHENRSL